MWGSIRQFPEPTTTAGSDLRINPSDHVKAIAFTAGFHFAFIEQAGTSLYATLIQKYPAWKSCESSSVSADPRSCTFRLGRTRPAMRFP